MILGCTVGHTHSCKPVTQWPCAGLEEDCPYQPAQDGQPAVQLSEDTVDAVPTVQFSDYVSRLYTYLQVRPEAVSLADSTRTACFGHL